MAFVYSKGASRIPAKPLYYIDMAERQGFEPLRHLQTAYSISSFVEGFSGIFNR